MIKWNNRLQRITQLWHESMSKTSKISNRIREMLKIRRKYNIAIDAPKFALHVKAKMPIWHHFAATDNYTWNKKSAYCLRKNHNIKTLGDIENFVMNRTATANCESLEKCHKIAKTLINKILGKYNINCTTPWKDNLDHTPRRIRRNAKKDITTTSITFNPDLTERVSIENAVRIFTNIKQKKRKSKGTTKTNPPAFRDRKSEKRKKKLVLYTDGSSNKNGSLTANNGLGVWHKENSKWNKSLKISGEN